MGGGDDQQTQTTGYQQLSPSLEQLLGQSTAGLGTALGALETPSTLALTTGYSPQQIPGLSANEVLLMNRLTGSAMSPQAQLSLSQPGTSPLFQQFLKQTMPQVLQQTGLQGLGQGAQAEAVSNAALGAALPIAQYDLQSALSRGQFGLQAQQQQFGELSQALGAAGLPRQITAQQYQAQYQERQRLQEFLQNILTAPFGALAGTGSKQVSTSQTAGGGK